MAKMSELRKITLDKPKQIWYNSNNGTDKTYNLNNTRHQGTPPFP